MTRPAAVLAVLLVVATATTTASPTKSFTIHNDTFYVDGAPFQIISGAIHYHRIHHALWADRLARAVALGLNTVEFYVPWNFHEPRPGQYDFAKDSTDLFRFISIAESYGLFVLMRVGPYICAEWDFGGLPAWLGSSAVAGGGTMRLRSSDPAYLAHVDRWWRVLLPRITPLLRTGPQHGPVLMVQIENEFGLCEGGGDPEYLAHLAVLARQILGPDTILFTTDPAHAAAGGTLPGATVLTAVDFGPGWPGAFDPDAYFETQRELNAPGASPPLDSEFYTGWLSHWGEAMANTTATGMAEDLAVLLRWKGASVNVYMAHGGTNFGLWAGANLDSSTGKYMPHITSYDYHAPISEAGQRCQPGIGGDGCKFKLIRDVIQSHTGRDLPPVPAEPVIKAYGAVALVDVGPLMAAGGLPHGTLPHSAETPAPMEEYGQQRGIIVYRTTIKKIKGNGGAVLDFGEPPHDYTTVLVGGKVAGRLERGGAAHLTLAPSFSEGEQTLEVVVEAMGRRNFGCEGGAWDLKGLQLPDVRLDGELLTGWEVFTFEFEDTSAVPVAPRPPNSTAQRRLLANPASLDPFSLFTGHINNSTDEGPRFYRGALFIQGAAAAEVTDAGGGRHLADTFLDTRGLGKGLAWVNGFLLGWYWPTQGPQMTLYVPGPLLRPGANDVLLLETQDAVTMGHAIKVAFVDQPDFWGPEGKAAASEVGRGAVGALSGEECSGCGQQQQQRSMDGWRVGGRGVVVGGENAAAVKRR